MGATNAQQAGAHPPPLPSLNAHTFASLPCEVVGAHWGGVQSIAPLPPPRGRQSIGHPPALGRYALSVADMIYTLTNWGDGIAIGFSIGGTPTILSKFSKITTR